MRRTQRAFGTTTVGKLLENGFRPGYTYKLQTWEADHDIIELDDLQLDQGIIGVTIPHGRYAIREDATVVVYKN